ncbi:MAG: glutamine--fructose-6-phosphate transaminase (isomerizing) [Puniceicoccales bacterium]|jgi:glucosamine--fructose-6-phosphate aminotransferase (isomerizing)|nr:glutamine--fructose-6-phosphate transaminase (isomerizing) [Puniceicoccales bacterium]
MCGIVGYVGRRPAAPLIFEGLQHLEYRGYDSAGIGLIKADDTFELYRNVGRVAALLECFEPRQSDSHVGIGHTRWATHGAVSVLNAHPHRSYHGDFLLVHNGVIENFKTLKSFLLEKDYAFYSDTDTEILANLIEFYYQQQATTEPASFLQAVQEALRHVQGTYGLAVLCQDCPNHLLAARNGSPLLIGIGDNEHIVASDAAAIVTYTSQVIYLRDREIALMSSDDLQICTLQSENVSAEVCTIDWSPEEAERGQHEHYMHKEIYEQAQVIVNAIRGHISDDFSSPRFGGLAPLGNRWNEIDRIVFCACGSAWHACLEAEYLIEHYAHIPVEVEYASEFRYRNAPLSKRTLVVVVSQSGETLDTLAALAEAKRRGYPVVGITNVVGSTISRETDCGIYQHAGPEIGVASTKAFTSQLCILAMLAVYLGRLRHMDYTEGVSFIQALQELPQKIEETLLLEQQISEIAQRYYQSEQFLFLGRQTLFPVALEGALKLKEIAYVYAQGYPSAEMKHGPIALVSKECPTVIFATQAAIFPKTLSNIQEIRARNGPIIMVATGEIPMDPSESEAFVIIPKTHPALQPILATIPAQFFAYHMALRRGCDVDKPRNLAKSVTVE